MFLDEVGELPMSTQVKLLRVLEERQVLRVGGRTPRPIDMRFIAATNRDLEAEAARGAFRQDLFFRLNGITLTIPPLRERTGGDRGAGADVHRAGVRAARPSEGAGAVGRGAGAARALRLAGNIRELRNTIERAVVLCAGETLLPEHLPSRLQARDVGDPPTVVSEVVQAIPEEPSSPPVPRGARRRRARTSASGSSPRWRPARATRRRRRRGSASRGRR